MQFTVTFFTLLTALTTGVTAIPAPEPTVIEQSGAVYVGSKTDHAAFEKRASATVTVIEQSGAVYFGSTEDHAAFN